ncbi:hypothetical protein T07_6129 [Trichinella nelsoni]|uniref:Uncharacterized protein n=1 Tax=Trichinella nelsoni TaxID=6336 RepID=A0A0V0SB96_9BILA|nr:hypothetical protein T07_6129 [Trichinella nelsoni]
MDTNDIRISDCCSSQPQLAIGKNFKEKYEFYLSDCLRLKYANFKRYDNVVVMENLSPVVSLRK